MNHYDEQRAVLERITAQMDLANGSVREVRARLLATWDEMVRRIEGLERGLAHIQVMAAMGVLHRDIKNEAKTVLAGKRCWCWCGEEHPGAEHRRVDGGPEVPITGQGQRL